MKIRAYTLMEVTVAMLISAICITICYTAYGLIGDYYRVFQERSRSADRVLSLKQVLEKDFLKSNLILRNEEGLLLQMDTSQVRYRFNEVTVVRELGEQHADTFRLELRELKSFFELRETVDTDTIDQVDLTVLLPKNIAVNIRLKKQYSAHHLFQ